MYCCVRRPTLSPKVATCHRAKWALRRHFAPPGKGLSKNTAGTACDVIAFYSPEAVIMIVCGCHGPLPDHPHKTLPLQELLLLNGRAVAEELPPP
jgi:hypothetical protein